MMNRAKIQMDLVIIYFFFFLIIRTKIMTIRPNMQLSLGFGQNSLNALDLLKIVPFEFLYLIKSGIICHKDAAIMHMLLRRHVLLTLTQTSFPPKDNKNISYNASTNASNKDSVHSFSLSLCHRGNRFTS